MEEGDHGAFKFGASASINGGGGEGLPDDRFADVGSYEQRYSGSVACQYKSSGVYFEVLTQAHIPFVAAHQVE